MPLRLLFMLLCLSVPGLSSAITLDSINVENLNGKKTIVHRVEAKETYYSIARKYNVSPQSVIQFNSNRSLQIGTILRVPTDRNFADAPVNTPAAATPGRQLIEYKVGPREYLIAIARKFNTTVDDIKSLNNLNGNNLAVGQVLKVPLGPPSAEIAAPPPQPLPTVSNDTGVGSIDSSGNASERLRLPPARYGLTEVTEKGVAVWISDENIDPSKMLALHPSAPIGTIVKITNPMTGKSTFTKVVGKFTLNESTRDATIVVTKAVADLLGVIDKRFSAILVYGMPNE